MRRLAILPLLLLPIFADAAEPATAGEAPLADDVAMLEHPRRVVDYTLRASLDAKAHTVHGEGTITWTNPSARPVQEIWLHLYLNAFKNQSSEFMRAPVGGFRGSTVPEEWGTIDVRKLTMGEGGADLLPAMEKTRKGETDETDARVPLPRSVAPGETVTFEMAWDDKLPSIVERTGHDGSFHMVAQWFPKIAKIEPDGTFAHFPFHHLAEFYADYGKYDVTLDVPAGFTIGATGPALESSANGGRRVERHVQDDVHDFAWTAWDRFEQRSETIDGVAVRILFPPGYDSIAERELDTMRFALPHFGRLYGKYPYGVLTLVHPPATAGEAGGMEYPTLITTGHASSWTPAGIFTPELVTIHEFGHQYFYGLLASNEMKWPFLDEGVNSYAEQEAMRAWKGPGSMVSMLGLELGDAEGHAASARAYEHDEPIAKPAPAFQTGNAYGSLVYSRTATILETLRRTFGDAKMKRALAVYARGQRFKSPTPQQLVEAVGAEVGPRAGGILRAALFDKGWVDYAVTATNSYASHAAAGIFDIDGKREVVATRDNAGKYEGWALIARRGTLKIPVDIELIGEDGTVVHHRWDTESDELRVYYNGSSPMARAVVDPEGKNLLDDDPTNDARVVPGHGSSGGRHVLERTTYWAELLLEGLGP